MATETSQCVGSWRPVPHLEPGDGVVCDHCKRQVHLRPAPIDLASTPWPGEIVPRIEPHSTGPRSFKSPDETPCSEG
jgi:hypothetical protein